MERSGGADGESPARGADPSETPRPGDAGPGSEPVRRLADQVFSRVAGAPLLRGNAVRLLKDASENYSAWLSAIGSARRSVHFENYLVHDDDVGRRFAEALRARAREGVPVRVLYDWLGCLGRSGSRFWRHLSEGGVEVRCFNPPRLSQPLGWIGRDHRKCLVVDGRVAFVTGLCLGSMWEGSPRRGLPPWRDTGVEVRGPAVAEVAHAFADSWAATGAPLPRGETAEAEPRIEGDADLRVIATTPGRAASTASTLSSPPSPAGPSGCRTRTSPAPRSTSRPCGPRRGTASTSGSSCPARAATSR